MDSHCVICGEYLADTGRMVCEKCEKPKVEGQQKAKKLPERKPCPICGSTLLWTVRLWPLRGPFTRYYIECRMCHCCGETKVGKRRAIRAWNRRAEDG